MESTIKSDVARIVSLGASEVAKLIAKGDLSSREAVEACISRADETDPRLNALVVKLFDQARAAADEADSARRRGEALGPLHGVPITIKEQFTVKGTASCFGLRSQLGQKAESDGPLVAALRDAGAIPLGKTNVSQFLMYIESDNPVYGRTLNPWDLRRSPGGSSGGEAAAVAAGMSFLGIGNDLGGSIREPAHFCGVHGFKPTTGRLTNLDTRRGIFPEGRCSIMTQPGPIARKVEDLELAMRVLSDHGLPDESPPSPWPRRRADVSALRIAWFDDDGFFPASPAIRRAVREAAEIASGLGATVERWVPPRADEAMRLYFGRLTALGTDVYRRALAKTKAASQIDVLFRSIELGHSARRFGSSVLATFGQKRLASILRWVGKRDEAGILAIEKELSEYRALFAASLDEGRYDAIICPPAALPAIPHGSSGRLNGFDSYARIFNALGMPAGVVAAGRIRPGEESDRVALWDSVDRSAAAAESGSAGLPVGVQVAARWWREDVVLAIMRELETAFRSRPEYPLTPIAASP
jgi:fatty acid amide hydrolase